MEWGRGEGTKRGAKIGEKAKMGGGLMVGEGGGWEGGGGEGKRGKQAKRVQKGRFGVRGSA